ncbi:uncharacterized protein LOC115221665 [Argonauta hians]
MMDNETLSFEHDGSNYFANFKYSPSASTENHLLYDGVLNGNGSCRGSRCVIRVMRTKWNHENACKSYLDTRKQLLEAKAYFSENPHNTEFFVVPDLTMALIDKVSCLAKIRCKNFPSPDEKVLIDHYKGACPEKTLNDQILQAISHFTFVKSGGKSILNNFQGFRINKTNCITEADTVPIDSATFFRHHKCNNYCVSLLNMTSFPAQSPKSNNIEIMDKNIFNGGYHKIITARASVPHEMYTPWRIHNDCNTYKSCVSGVRVGGVGYPYLAHSYSMYTTNNLRLEPSAPPFDEVFRSP